MSEDEGFVTIRELFKGGGALLIGLVLELSISFFGKLIVARELERVDYGGVSLGIVTAAIVSTLVLLGVNTGIGRYLPRYDSAEKRRGVLLSGLEISIPISLAATAVIVIGAPTIATVGFNDPSLAPILRVFGFAIPFGALMKLSIGGIRGLQDSVSRVLVENITFPTTRIVGIVAAILLGYGVLGIAFAYAFSYVIAAALGLYILAKQTALFDRSVDPFPMRRELLTFSLPLVVTAAMSIVLSDIDMYMLGFLRDAGVVADYNVIYPLSQLLMSAQGAFGFLFMPVVSELDATGNHDELDRLYKIVTKWIVMVTLPMFLVLTLFPAQTISLTFGSKYLGGATSLSVLSLGFFIHTCFGLNKGALTSLGHTRLIMYDDIVGAGFNIVLNLLLIPEFGLLGAAWATTASYVLLNGMYSVQLYRRTAAHPLSLAMVKPLVVGIVAMGVVATAARAYLSSTALTLVGVFTVFVLVYGIGILRFGVEPEEVRLVLSFEERFNVDLGPLKRVAMWFM